MTPPAPGAQSGGATVERLRHLAPGLSDEQVAAVMAMGPSEEELEKALAWNADSVPDKRDLGGGLSGREARIYEIVSADAAWPDEEAQAPALPPE